MKKKSTIKKLSIDGKNYKAQLYNVKYYEELSDETNACSGSLIITDCSTKETTEFPFKNDGHGGETDIYWNKDNKELYNIVEKYLGTVEDSSLIAYFKQYGMPISEKPMMSMTRMVDELFETCF